MTAIAGLHLSLGDAKAKGRPGDRRIEVELVRSERRARDVKRWLVDNKYFSERNRVGCILLVHVGTAAAADDKVASATGAAEAPGWVQGLKQEMQGFDESFLPMIDRETPSGCGSASPGIDEDPEVLVTEWDVLADNMALMHQDAAEHCLEPVEKLDPVKMAQNAKKKCAAAPSTDAGGSQKSAPVVSSAKTRVEGVIAVRMDANSPVSTQVNNIIISLGK
jgi:hypothetical protein